MAMGSQRPDVKTGTRGHREHSVEHHLELSMQITNAIAVTSYVDQLLCKRTD